MSTHIQCIKNQKRVQAIINKDGGNYFFLRVTDIKKIAETMTYGCGYEEVKELITAQMKNIINNAKLPSAFRDMIQMRLNKYISSKESHNKSNINKIQSANNEQPINQEQLNKTMNKTDQHEKTLKNNIQIRIVPKKRAILNQKKTVNNKRLSQFNVSKPSSSSGIKVYRCRKKLNKEMITRENQKNNKQNNKNNPAGKHSVVKVYRSKKKLNKDLELRRLKRTKNNSTRIKPKQNTKTNV